MQCSACNGACRAGLFLLSDNQTVCQLIGLPRQLLLSVHWAGTGRLQRALQRTGIDFDSFEIPILLFASRRRTLR